MISSPSFHLLVSLRILKAKCNPEVLELMK